jgi:DNA-binding NtrC family response regulator
MDLLTRYNWPGNVREIANVLEHITQLSRGRQITPEDLPEKIKIILKENSMMAPKAQAPLIELIEGWESLPTLEELERRYIQVLLKHEPKKNKIAEILGKDRTTLYRRIKDLGLDIVEE